jgi:hypothetical protein
MKKTDSPTVAKPHSLCGEMPAPAALRSLLLLRWMKEVRRHLTDHEFDGYCQKGQPPTSLVALVMSFAQ